MLYEFSVKFESSIRDRFYSRSIYDSDTKANYSLSKTLGDMKTIEDNFSLQKKHSNLIVVGTEYAYGNNFDMPSHLSGIMKEMIMNAFCVPSIYII